MYYIENRHTSPYHNLALEQFVFDRLDKQNSYFMLWQNHNAIIVGKYQNTQEEINAAFVKETDISLARRIEGCGKIEIFLDIEKEGKIKNIFFYGDFFGNLDPAGLRDTLKGHHLEYEELKTVLRDIEISQYFHNMDRILFWLCYSINFGGAFLLTSLPLAHFMSFT